MILILVQVPESFSPQHIAFDTSGERVYIGDGGTLGKKLGEVGAGDVRRDAFKWAAGGGAGFWIPGFKLAGSAAKPKENTVFLLFLGNFSERRRSK